MAEFVANSKEWQDVPQTGHSIVHAAVGLAAVITVAWLTRLLLWVGFQGSDDIAAFHMAKALAEGSLRPDAIIQNLVAALRYGLTLPVALLFYLFGNTENVAVSYVLFTSLVGVAAAWDITRRLTKSLPAAHFAGLLLAFSSLDIGYSTIFYPDTPMAAYSLVSLWCVVTGYAPCRLGRLRLFLAGACAGFVWMHKEAGAQLAIALALWGFAVLTARQFRPRLLLIGVGFLVVFAAEHILMAMAFDDPFYRWAYVIEASLDNAAERALATGREISWIERLTDFSFHFARKQPSFVIITGLGLIATFILSWRKRRDVAILLVCVYAITVFMMRIPELTQTYSYQPRRLVPLAGPTAILMAVFLDQFRRQRMARVTAAYLLLLLQFVTLVKFDVSVIRRDASRIDVERQLHAWMRADPELVRKRKLYVDDRTYMILYLLIGSSNLEQQGLLCWNNRAPLGGPLTEGLISPGAFYFENCRLLNWLAPYRHREKGFEKYFADIPPSWNLIAIFQHPLAPSYNGALYEVCDDQGAVDERTSPFLARLDQALGLRGRHRPEKGMHHGWYVNDDAVDARMSPIPSEGGHPGLAIDFRKGTRLTLVSGGGITKAPPKTLICAANERFALTIPVEVDLRSIAAKWTDCTVKVVGYKASGPRKIIYARKYRLFYPEQTLRAYVAPEFDLYGIRVMIELADTGRYELHPPRFMAVKPRDAQNQSRAALH